MCVRFLKNMNVITQPTLRVSFVTIIIVMILTWSSPSLTTTTAQQPQQQTPSTTTPSQPTPPLTPPLTLQEQEQQIRLQNVIASTTLNLQETQKQISGVVFTPRWSEPVWVNANSVAVLIAYCLPGEFADSGQEILGGFELEILESYAVALPQGYMVWMAVVGNEDLQNRRFPAALGVICASDLNKPETRVLSPEKQQEINKINQRFVNIQNTQITDIDNIINTINTVTTTTTTTTAIPPPTPITPPPQSGTGGGATTTTLAAPVQQDTTPPTIIVPEDIVVQATGEQGTPITYIVTAQDNVDGTAMLNENNILTQDNAPAVYANMDGTAPPMPGGGGNTGTMTPAPAPQPNPPVGGGDITIVCDPTSPIKFDALIGDAVVRESSGDASAYNAVPIQCYGTDSAGNVGTASFTVTVTPGEEGEGETAQLVQEEEPPPAASPAEGGEEQGEGETTDAEALLPPPAGEEQQPPASEGEGEGGEEENEGEPSEE
jgi:hypothetical protein